MSSLSEITLVTFKKVREGLLFIKVSAPSSPPALTPLGRGYQSLLSQIKKHTCPQRQMEENSLTTKLECTFSSVGQRRLHKLQATHSTAAFCHLDVFMLITAG